MDPGGVIRIASPYDSAFCHSLVIRESTAQVPLDRSMHYSLFTFELKLFEREPKQGWSSRSSGHALGNIIQGEEAYHP
jgi:hypothetical protein